MSKSGQERLCFVLSWRPKRKEQADTKCGQYFIFFRCKVKVKTSPWIRRGREAGGGTLVIRPDGKSDAAANVGVWRVILMVSVRKERSKVKRSQNQAADLDGDDDADDDDRAGQSFKSRSFEIIRQWRKGWLIFCLERARTDWREWKQCAGCRTHRNKRSAPSHGRRRRAIKRTGWATEKAGRLDEKADRTW